MSDAARALIAAEIGGDLTLTEHLAKVKLRHPNAFIELADHPVTMVQEVRVGDAVVDVGEYGFNRFGVERLATWWPANVPITVSYKTGWTPGEEPLDIKQALAMTDAWLGTNPETGITEVRAGDDVVRRGVTRQDLPPGRHLASKEVGEAVSLLSAGKGLLKAGQAQAYTYALELLTPGVTVKVWDETLDDYVTTPGEPAVRWSGLGSLQPVLKREDADTGTVGGAEGERPTYRAYLPDTPETRAAIQTPGVYLVDAEPDSLTRARAFVLLKKAVQQGGVGSLRLELKEA